MRHVGQWQEHAISKKTPEIWKNFRKTIAYPLLSSFVIKHVIIGVIFLALGGAFFVQKQHERKQALELAQRKREASQKAHVSASVPQPASQPLPQATLTPLLAPTPKPKPTPMLPKPTPMLHRSPTTRSKEAQLSEVALALPEFSR
jgi:hypothetical protein